MTFSDQAPLVSSSAMAVSPPSILFGVITAPSHAERRNWLRRMEEHRLLTASGAARHLFTLTQRFVLGRTDDLQTSCGIDSLHLLTLLSEIHTQGDFLQLNTSECTWTRATQKTLRFFLDFARGFFGLHTWVAKVDDDTMVDVDKLWQDLKRSGHIASPSQPFFALYGGMRWRLWRPDEFMPCGMPSERMRYDRHPDALRISYKNAAGQRNQTQVASGWNNLPCGQRAHTGTQVAGPFPYAECAYNFDSNIKPLVPT